MFSVRIRLNALGVQIFIFCAAFLASDSALATVLRSEWTKEFDQSVSNNTWDYSQGSTPGFSLCASESDRQSQEAFIKCVQNLNQTTAKATNQSAAEISSFIKTSGSKFSPKPFNWSLLNSWWNEYVKNSGKSMDGWDLHAVKKIDDYCKESKSLDCAGQLISLRSAIRANLPGKNAVLVMNDLLDKWEKASRKNPAADSEWPLTAPKPKSQHIPQHEEEPIQIKARAHPKPKPSHVKGTGSPEGGGGFSGKSRDQSLNACEVGLQHRVKSGEFAGCATNENGSTPDPVAEALAPAHEIAKEAGITTDTYFQKLRKKAFEKYYGAFILRFGELPFDGLPKDCTAPEYADIVKNAPKVDLKKSISTHFADYRKPATEIVELQKDAERFKREIKDMEGQRKSKSIDEMIKQRKNLIAEARARIGEIVQQHPLLISDIDPSADFLNLDSLPLASTVAAGAAPGGDSGHADKELVFAKINLMKAAREAMQHFCSAQWSDLVKSKELTEEVLKEPGNEIFKSLQKCSSDILKRREAHQKVAGALAGVGCLGAALALPVVGGAICSAYMLTTSAQHLKHALHERDLVEACRLAGNAVCDEKEWKEAVSELHGAQIHMGLAVAGAGIYVWSASAHHAAHALELAKKAAEGTADAASIVKTASLITDSQSGLKNLLQVLKEPKTVAKLGAQKTKEISEKLAALSVELLSHMKHDPAHAAHVIHNIEHTYAEIKNTSSGLSAFGILVSPQR